MVLWILMLFSIFYCTAGKFKPYRNLRRRRRDVAWDAVPKPMVENWGCPADLLTNQTVQDPKVHCHTLRAQQVEIEPTSPPTRVVALPTMPQIPM
jgi:hypothetical protein